MCWRFESASDVEKKADEVIQVLSDHGYWIDEVIFEGQSDVSPAEFLRITGLSHGCLITPTLIKKAVFYLFKKDVYHAITVMLTTEGRKRQLIFNVERAWRMGKLHIGGILVGKERYRHQYLLRYGDWFDRAMHEYGKQQMLKDLHNQGYHKAIITDSLAYNEALKEVTVRMHIQPGVVFYIDAVDCTVQNLPGLPGIMPEVLSAQLRQKFLLPLNNKPYQQEVINAHVNALFHYLMNKGLYPQDIQLQEMVHQRHRRISLSLTIPLSFKRTFIFFGNYSFTEQQLRDAIFLFGQAAWHMPASFLAEELVRFYKDHGFSGIEIESKQEGDVCYFLIKEGEDHTPARHTASNQEILNVLAASSEHEMSSSVVFGSTLIAYSSSLPERYVLRELAYKEGQPWSPEKVNKSLVRLKRLGIFDSVQLVPFYDPYTPNAKAMILKAVLDDPYELRVRAGMSLQQMSKEFTFKTVAFVGGGSFIWKNPFNKADQLLLEVDYTRGERTATAKYIRPWIFNYPVKLTLKGYSTQYWQPSLVNEHKNLYEFRQQGSLLGLQYVNEYTFETSTGIEWMETQVTPHYNTVYAQEVARALNFEPQLLNKRVPFFTFEPTLVIDRADNKLNPHHGSLTVITLKGMFPIKYRDLTTSFIKLFCDQAVYIPLHQTVLALRLRFGHIFHHNFKNIMPAERFYAGGANSIRSYDTDLCPPLGIVASTNPNSPVLVPQGAQSMVVANAELRFPVYKIFSGALFQDVGALSNTVFTDIRMKDVLAGTGFGIRVNTPIGPLRFDVAFKWQKPDQFSSRYAWFLTFGNAF